jgi:DNA-binding transcriptional regulator YdaS (Cro superfamily)
MTKKSGVLDVSSRCLQSVTTRTGLTDRSYSIVDIVLFIQEHIAMTGSELKAALAELALAQADFARLIGVTPRAVNLWVSDGRGIPGPAEAYLRVFQLLPPNLRQNELGRLKERGTGMRDGMFGVSFHGQKGGGLGVLVFDSGRVYGTDSEGARYDGEYVFHEEADRADVVVKVTFPANVLTVFGISNPYEWAIDVSTSFNPKQNVGSLDVKTSLGQPVGAQFRFLRPLPDAA